MAVLLVSKMRYWNCLKITIENYEYLQVTAITFVALGTSLPDTFASKVAAVNEKTADNAIGNVTGSNSVNVFLGLGIPWIIAAIYHAIYVRLDGALFALPCSCN